MTKDSKDEARTTDIQTLFRVDVATAFLPFGDRETVVTFVFVMGWSRAAFASTFVVDVFSLPVKECFQQLSSSHGETGFALRFPLYTGMKLSEGI